MTAAPLTPEEERAWRPWAAREGMKDLDDMPHERDVMDRLFKALDAARAELAMVNEAMRERAEHTNDSGAEGDDMKCDECGKDVQATVGWGASLPVVGVKQLCLDCFDKACAKVGAVIKRAMKADSGAEGQ